MLGLEALLHTVSALCSGHGADVLGYVSPLPPSLVTPTTSTQEMSTEMIHGMTRRNSELFDTLNMLMSELFMLNRDLLGYDGEDEKSHQFAYACPLLRLVVVLVIDLFEPIMTHFAAKSCADAEGAGGGRSALQELRGYTTSCCELLLQSVYIREAINVGTGCMNATGGSQVSFVGALIPFRVKQDHIGCVSTLKMSQIIQKMLRNPSTRAVFHCMSREITGDCIPYVLPQLLCHLEIIVSESSPPASSSSSFPVFSTRLYTAMITHSQAVLGRSAEVFDDTVLLWVKVFTHHLITLGAGEGGQLSTPWFVTFYTRHITVTV